MSAGALGWQQGSTNVQRLQAKRTGFSLQTNSMLVGGLLSASGRSPIISSTTALQFPGIFSWFGSDFSLTSASTVLLRLLLALAGCQSSPAPSPYRVEERGVLL